MNIAILHRYPVSEIKGTNPAFLYFLKELKDGGHNLFVVTLQEKYPRSYPVMFSYYPFNFQFKRANDLDKWLKSLIFMVLAPVRVRSLKARFGIDLVYCDDSLPFYAYLVKKIARLPVVMRLGDLQTAYLFYSQGLLGRLCYKILHAFEKATWKKVDRIIAISESFRRFLVKEGINPEKISVVGESIDISEFRSGADREDLRKKYALTDAPVLMFHGLISKIKGLDILLKAIPACRKTIPDLKIMLVGDGPQLNHLKKLSVKLGLASCVVFTGWVPFEQVPDYISACNIGLPLRSANLGNNFVVTTAFLQYAALKKPVIVPGLEAYKDTLADNPHQFIFDLNRPETLSGCIADLLNDKEKAARTCENNYKMALEKFAAVKIANELAREVLI